MRHPVYLFLHVRSFLPYFSFLRSFFAAIYEAAREWRLNLRRQGCHARVYWTRTSAATCTSFPSSARFPWAGNSDYYCERRAFYCMLGSVSGSLRRNGNSTRGSFSSPPSPPPRFSSFAFIFRLLLSVPRVYRSSNDRIHLPERRAATSRRVRGGKGFACTSAERA